MEFAVRLKDKINTSVHCLNPVHNGTKTVYDDPTFSAPCPYCDSSLYLYRKNNACTKKGNLITFKPDGWPWGTEELKEYGFIRIDCTEAEAKEFCRSEGMNAAFFASEQRRLHTEMNLGPTEAVRKKAREDVAALERSKEIQYRARAHIFDFEIALTNAQKNNWKNKNTASYIISLEEGDKVHIR